jgi:hypothetical protein
MSLKAFQAAAEVENPVEDKAEGGAKGEKAEMKKKKKKHVMPPSFAKKMSAMSGY